MMLIRSLLILVFWGGMSSGALANAQSGSSDSVEREDVSKRLEGFIDQAVGAGLLTEPGDGAGARERGTTADCPEVYPFDFSDYQDIQRYADIAPYREAANEEAGSAGTVSLVKAYLALGLYAEAIANQDRDALVREHAYTELARLMDGYRKADEALFAALAECHEAAGLWHGVSLLASKDISGAGLIERHVEAFRDLPIRLRSDVASLILPTLRHNGKTLLAKKLLATFSQEEISQSGKLDIQASFIEAKTARANGTRATYDFLSGVSPEIGELLASNASDAGFGEAQEAIILEETYKILSRSTDGQDIAVALQFALGALKEQNGYDAFARLLDMPSLSAPAFQQEIKELLAERLMADLQSTAHSSKFSAVNLLANDREVIAGHRSEEKLVRTAVDFLETEGRFSLAVELLQGPAPTGDDALLSARLAYRQNNLERLDQLVQANMENPDIVYLGAMSAIENEDTDAFRSLETYLPGEVEPLLALAEQDAVTGGWVLSEKSYETVRLQGNPEQVMRLEKLLLLKNMERETEADRDVSGPGNIGGRLAASAARLGAFYEEAG